MISRVRGQPGPVLMGPPGFCVYSRWRERDSLMSCLRARALDMGIRGAILRRELDSPCQYSRGEYNLGVCIARMNHIALKSFVSFLWRRERGMMSRLVVTVSIMLVLLLAACEDIEPVAPPLTLEAAPTQPEPSPVPSPESSSEPSERGVSLFRE